MIRAEFEDAIRQFTKRFDYGTADFDEIFRGGEADLSRDLRVWELIGVEEVATSSGEGPAPADYAEARSATVYVNRERRRLEQATFEQLSALDGVIAPPDYYTVLGASLYVAPWNADASIRLEYFRRSPTPPAQAQPGAFTDDDITTRYASTYRAAYLVHAFQWGQDYAAAELWTAQYAALVDLSNGASEQALLGQSRARSW